MWQSKNKGDVENGGMTLAGGSMVKMINEPPELRWAFIRKVYTIISIQLLLTAGVACAFIFVEPLNHFMKHIQRYQAILIMIAIFVYTLVVSLILAKCHKKHPVNFLVLALFTAGISVLVGFLCSLVQGKVILMAAILTAVMVLSLTLYTFWAVKRGHDFSFLGPFLFASAMVLFVFALIQIFFPLGKLTRMIYSALAAILWCGFIVYDTNNLIKIYTYDDYIWASVNLYSDIVQLFLNLLTFLREL